MTKKGLLQTLSRLKNVFTSDEANEALRTLVKEAESLPDDETAAVEFPIPDEVDSGYAVFSDGACRGNPGPGAWGAMGQDSSGSVLFQSSGIESRTTNNRMELEGAYEGLRALVEILEESNLDPAENKIYLYSDSKYVVDGMAKWVSGWKKRGWKKADGKVPENVEMWMDLDSLREELPLLSFRWVKGHAGHPQNEHCDLLANQALDDAGF